MARTASELLPSRYPERLFLTARATQRITFALS